VLIINDFQAVGYGVCNLNPSDYTQLNQAKVQEGFPKAVVGAGTGLGMGYLTKSKFAPFYEVWACEGGHTDFSILGEEDWDLHKFSKKFIEESTNVENLRAKGRIYRVSAERVCAGPAVPMLYAFMKERHKELDSVLEKEMEFDAIESYHIIEAGMKKKDPLCMKVIDKFTALLGQECGNMALKTLPYGGLYLAGGGVTSGIKDYLTGTSVFLDNFYAKGRIEGSMRHVPVFLVKEEANIGLKGAEECAYRLLAHS